MNNHEAMDDMADWAVNNPSPRHEPQGRESQPWPLRAGSPEWAVYEPEDTPREVMSALEAWGLMAAYVSSVVFTCWCFWTLAGVIKGWV